MGVLEVYSEFEKLSLNNKKQFYDMIYPVVINSSDEIIDYLKDIRETRFAKAAYCPHCKSKHIIGHGKYRSRQRYKCKDCGKTFNDISCSPMAGTHYPDKWSRYIQCIADGMTLPKIVKVIDISISTAFYWRHKVLNSLRSMEIDSLSGIIESDETFFLESFKGKNQCKTRKPNRNGGVSTKFMENYLFWSRFLELNKSLDKAELKRTLLTLVLATNRATTVNSLRPKKVA